MKSFTLLTIGFAGVMTFAQTKPLLKLQLANRLAVERKQQSVEVSAATVAGIKNKIFVVKTIRQRFHISGCQTGGFYYRQTLSLMKKNR